MNSISKINVDVQNAKNNNATIIGGTALGGAALGASGAMLSKVTDDEFINSAKKIIDKKVGTNWGDAFAQLKKAILFDDEKAIRTLITLFHGEVLDAESVDKIVKNFAKKRKDIDNVTKKILVGMRGKNLTDTVLENLPASIKRFSGFTIKDDLNSFAEELANWKSCNPNKSTLDFLKKECRNSMVSDLGEAILSLEEDYDLIKTPEAQKQVADFAKKTFNIDMDLSSLDSAKKSLNELATKTLPEFIDNKLLTKANAERLDAVLEKSKNVDSRNATKMLADELEDIFKLNNWFDGLKDGAEKLAKAKKAGKFAIIGAGIAALGGGIYALVNGNKKSA